MSEIKNIIVHCSASDFGSAAIINQWHRERGWGTNNPYAGAISIGYHFVVLNGFPTSDHFNRNERLMFLTGSVEVGRPINTDLVLALGERGAHALGYNNNSLGVCLILDHKKYCPKQQIVSAKWMLRELLAKLKLKATAVIGHYEVDPSKSCPNLDMRILRSYVADEINAEDAYSNEKFFTK